MAKKITQEQFLTRMSAMHPQYDFSQFTYIGNAVKSTVACSVHGLFEANPNSLSNGQGCPKCGLERRALARTVSFDDFAAQAFEAHGGRYEYIEASWTGMSQKVSIRCPSHDLVFNQQASAHINQKHGCPKCGRERAGDILTDDLQTFITKCHSVHGEKYDLSKIIYAGSTEKIEVVCQEHGSFFPKAGNFINRKSGCPKCANKKTALRCRKPIDLQIADFREAHGDKYDYLEVFYKNQAAYIRAICPEHGEFTQLAQCHKTGHGCIKCSGEIRDTRSFIDASRRIHGDTYDYSGVDYVNSHTIVSITCREHGPFEQRPMDHTHNNQGCPTCGRNLTSKGQSELATMLREHVEVVDNYVLPSKKHIDIFLPEYNIGVEYHGLIWHSEKFQSSHMRDYAKHKEAAALGIRIIHIYSDEWLFREHVVRSMLLQVVGEAQRRVFARKCTIELVNDTDAFEFYEDNHIQGGVGTPCRNIGLSLNGELLALMSFSRVTSIRGAKQQDDVCELRRFATSCSVVGGASRLLQAFLRSYPSVTSVISYSDNRLFSGKTYETLGFNKESVSEPSYCYVNPSVKWREEKHKFTRVKMAKRDGFNFDPALSEKDNCEANKWYRVYDCGKTKWVLTVK